MKADGLKKSINHESCSLVSMSGKTMSGNDSIE